MRGRGQGRARSRAGERERIRAEFSAIAGRGRGQSEGEGEGEGECEGKTLISRICIYYLYYNQRGSYHIVGLEGPYVFYLIVPTIGQLFSVLKDHSMKRIVREPGQR